MKIVQGVVAAHSAQAQGLKVCLQELMLCVNSSGIKVFVISEEGHSEL